ncbi:MULTISPECIES: hypothetical protein [Pseudomonas]|uniref:Phage protein n=1 Tax=Pseudomonas luteola TaxID=47886 RepID=A0ABS0FN79_PSELU|nr:MULTISPECIES: hypothetical protein [Pseudomonas]MBF8641810.1 hypothetical protein [Pseudomonas zeshuii]RRW48568.1 hypothetical protein EGJ50_08305 [Pseudomonas luteola]SHI92557.1 hypothetical protein SAMN05216295_10564 [Pseudomonas zeshuii]
MDVRIGTGEVEYGDLDFYYGAKALEGTSEVVALVAHTILNKKLAKQVPSVEGIRARLKKSFVGSFGQKFELDIYGEEQLRVFNYLGEDGFFQLMQYYIGQAVGVDYPITKPVAKKWDEIYIEDEVELIQRIYEPVMRMHKPIESQGYAITLSKRRSALAVFNNKTLEFVKHEVKEPKTVEIKAVITKFNRLTGTGRLILGEEAASVSFSSAKSWRMFPLKERKILSRNLDKNNGAEDFDPINLEVTRITSVGGVVKHYKIHKAWL